MHRVVAYHPDNIEGLLYARRKPLLYKVADISIEVFPRFSKLYAYLLDTKS